MPEREAIADREYTRLPVLVRAVVEQDALLYIRTRRDLVGEAMDAAAGVAPRGGERLYSAPISQAQVEAIRPVLGGAPEGMRLEVMEAASAGGMLLVWVAQPTPDRGW